MISNLSGVGQLALDANLLFKEAKSLLDFNYENAMECAERAAVLAQDENNVTLYCDILTFLSRYKRIHGEAYTSISLLARVYRILKYNLPKDKKRLAYVLREFGTAYSNDFNDYVTGTEYFLKCLKFDIKELNPIIYNNIANNYIHLGKYSEALAYLSKGLEEALRMDNLLIISYIFENYGELYTRQKDYYRAFKNFEKGLINIEHALKDQDKVKDCYLIKSILHIGMARCYFDKEELDLGIKELKVAIDIAKDKNFKSVISEANLYIGQYYLLIDEFDKYFDLFEEMRVFCTDNSFHKDIEQWYVQLAQLYENRGEFEKALIYAKEINKIRETTANKNDAINLTNILEGKELEIFELEKRNSEIREKNNDLEQFAYIVTHDLKTPLSNICNFAGLFNKKYEEIIDEKGSMYLNVIIDSSKHLTDMLSDLMQYIKLDKKDDGNKVCNADTVCKIALNNYQSIIEEKGAIIIKEELPTLPIRDFHLEHILYNLIGNALKFNKEGEAPQIEISYLEDNFKYIVAVKDNGIGISKDYYDQVFEIFKQLDKSNYKGTGMGLAICKKIVNKYSGELWIKSREGVGSTFYFSLPKIKDEQHKLLESRFKSSSRIILD